MDMQEDSIQRHGNHPKLNNELLSSDGNDDDDDDEIPRMAIDALPGSKQTTAMQRRRSIFGYKL
jgi:hypothetical protein